MFTFKAPLTIACFAGTAFLLSGCSESPASDSTDHGHEHHEGADHDHDHPENAETMDEHGNENPLGSVEIAGTTFEVSFGGEIEPGAEMHINLNITDGPKPAAVRLWVGDEAATGSIKGKADATDDGFHGHAEVPAELTEGAALWIEIESDDGSRTTGSIDLPE